MPKIAVIGEGVIDRFISGDTHKDVIGGSGLNTAVALKRAGSNGIWFTRLSSDANGQLLSSYAATEGVLDSNATKAAEPAPLVKVHLSDSGQPKYEFELEGAADWQWSATELLPLKSEYAVIQIGSLSAVLDPGATVLIETLRDLKSSGSAPLITYDPNARPSAASDEAHADLMKERINQVVELADMVKVSDEDLSWIFPNQDAAESARKWSERGPQLVVMTMGGDGAVAYHLGKEIARVPGEKIQVVDTVGAGDTFMAWLIHGLASAHDCKVPTTEAEISSLLSKAAKAAAITCSREGCKPPFANEFV